MRYFSFELSKGFKYEKTINLTEISLRGSVGYFYNDNNKYICIYISFYNYFRIKVYDNLINPGGKSNVYDSNFKDENTLFKGIHIKEEIGFFI